VSPDEGAPPESAEELFENAPCGYLTTRMDGTIVRVNRTFEDWTGHTRDALLGTRFVDLLAPGGRIYHETHFAPLLQMQGSVREIALDVVRADGSRLPALVNAVVRDQVTGPPVVRTTIFDASDRRRYEQELVLARTRERDIALELQQAMLSGELPQDARVRTEVVYRPAVRGLQVGGDWYDAFRLESPDAVALVVGDVVGRGIGAAATMGQLRSAVRALASTGLGPAALLEALDRFAKVHGVGRMATLAYARVDVASRRVRYACAGHPPPAAVAPGGAARLLWDGRSLPLDAHGAGARAEGELELAPGGGLVLYSDGLVERRSRPLGDGFDALVAALERAEPAPGAGLAASLADALLGDDARDDDDDDVCVLGVPA
jgi:sigma-B regulation protein RsbU (phosphoserine phosphatase)